MTANKYEWPAGRVIGKVRLEDQGHDDDTDRAISVQPNRSSTAHLPQITNLASLDIHLPEICARVFQHIGSQQLEATYQQCLKIDLQEAGIRSVELEPEIQLTYRGKVVGTRRADILLELSSGEKAILELKAVDDMSIDHMKQLEYYLHHSGVNKGYLINFPHDCQYPRVDDKSSFRATLLRGIVKRVENVMRGGSALRLKNSPQKREVEVIEVTRRTMNKSEQEAATILRSQRKPPTFGVKANGEPCQRCINQQKFCFQHLDQTMDQTVNKSDQTFASIFRSQRKPPTFGVKANGEPCQRCINQQKFCFQHLDQKPSP
jgi:GxxExxY protein